MYDYFGLPCNMDDLEHPVWIEYNKFKSNNPVELYLGIRNIIEYAKKEKRLKLALNTTNSFDKSVEDLFKREKIYELFDYIFDADIMVKHAQSLGTNPKNLRKPNNYSIQHITNVLKLNPDYVLHVGDTRTDLGSSLGILNEEGKPLDLRTIGVTWGFEPRKILEEGFQKEGKNYHFNYIIDQVEELIKIIKNK